MSCICFFIRNCSNYSELHGNLNYLNKASRHLEQYLEVSATKQFQATSQQQIAWKQQKSELPSLCKQMSTQEIDK